MRSLLRKYLGPFTGHLAHTLQRLTGLLLLLYLFLHVRTIYALAGGPQAFDRAVSNFRTPLFHLLEIGLLGVVILHALNGLRITLLDLGVAQSRQRSLFWIFSVALGAIVFLAAAIPLFLASVLGR